MKPKIVFILAVAGLLLGLGSAYVYREQHPALPPAFTPAADPYPNGIYAEGIVESFQKHGANINIYPEVSGTITAMLVSEGQRVAAGTPLFTIDSSVQRKTVAQLQAQAMAAHALLAELKAEPRPENLAVVKAQVGVAAANLSAARDSFEKLNRAYRLDTQSVSRNALDSARDSVRTAAQNLNLARRQYELTKAGAWIYDIRNQEQQYQAFLKAYAASRALLGQYTVRAPTDGVVLSISASAGSYVSSTQGVYDTYTQGSKPIVVMGHPQNVLEVRCYVDEILIHRLPRGSDMKAELFVRGTDIKIHLHFVRVEPYVSPKIELSNQRTERVDVRVLPVIFKFTKPKKVNLYPGQLVDVYIGGRKETDR